MLSFASVLQAAPLSCEDRYRLFETAKNEHVSTPRAAKDIQLTAVASLCAGWEIVDLWRTWIGDGGQRLPVWHARRKQMGAVGDMVTQQLDSIGCPMLLGRLVRLRTVPITLDAGVLPPVMSRFPPPQPPAPPPTDGTNYTLSLLSAEQPGSSFAQVIVSTSHGPLADWARETQDALKPCWHPVSRSQAPR